MEVDSMIKKAFGRGYLFGLERPDLLSDLDSVLNGSSPYCKAFQEGVNAGKVKALKQDKPLGKDKGKGFGGKIEF